MSGKKFTGANQAHTTNRSTKDTSYDASDQYFVGHGEKIFFASNMQQTVAHVAPQNKQGKQEQP
jgi:hypothetical protein